MKKTKLSDEQIVKGAQAASDYAQKLWKIIESDLNQIEEGPVKLLSIFMLLSHICLEIEMPKEQAIRCLKGIWCGVEMMRESAKKGEKISPNTK